MDFVKELKKLKLQNIPVSIYTDSDDPEYFSFGYIAGVDDEFVYLSHITPRGLEDGILLKRLDEVFRLEYSGEYEKRLVRLYRIKAQRHKDYLSGMETLGLHAFLLHAMQQRQVITLTLGIQSITGFLHSVEGDKVCLTELNADGVKLGEIILPTQHIRLVSCDSLEERDIALLYKHGL